MTRSASCCSDQSSVPAGRIGITRYRMFAVLSCTLIRTSSGTRVPNSASTARGTGHDGGSGSAAAGADNGGGGGWFGGGGGGSGDVATGGGGGGSGYAAPDLSAELTPGVRAGDGQVTVTHDAT